MVTIPWTDTARQRAGALRRTLGALALGPKVLVIIVVVIVIIVVFCAASQLAANFPVTLQKATMHAGDTISFSDVRSRCALPSRSIPHAACAANFGQHMLSSSLRHTPWIPCTTLPSSTSSTCQCSTSCTPHACTLRFQLGKLGRGQRGRPVFMAQQWCKRWGCVPAIRLGGRLAAGLQRALPSLACFSFFTPASFFGVGRCRLAAGLLGDLGARSAF